MSVADTRYGRQGGGWIDTKPLPRTPRNCWVCRQVPAACTAVGPDGERWPSCDRCRHQAERKAPAIRYEPLDDIDRQALKET